MEMTGIKPTIANQQTSLSALQETELFQAMSDQEAYGLFAASQKVELEKGTILHLQGDKADWFYLVLSGWVKIFRETLDGEEAVIDLATRGQFIGELALLEGGTYSCNAAIAETTTLLRMPSSMLSAAIKNNHSVALAMLNVMSGKRQKQLKEVEGLKLQKADQRIGCFVLRLCRGQPSGAKDVVLPYDKSLIAMQLGMKGETFSRALNKLRLATGVEVTGKDVRIPDIDQLSNFACAACSNEYPCKDLVKKLDKAVQ